MTHYIDIRLMPDPEFSAAMLMNSLYSKLHKALYDLNATGIGVSFPNYQVTLGDNLRLHGSAEDLGSLMDLNWIGPMISYCKVSGIQPVPSQLSYRTVSRKQPNMTPAKLRRLIKRGNITEDEVKNYRAKMFSNVLNEPYLELISGSSGHRHRRYIEFGELVSEPVAGQFDQFGLSKTATIPWF